MMVILPVEVEAQTTIYSTQTGDWKDTSTWLGGVVPGTTDTVYICDGHTVTLDDNRSVKWVQINATSTLQIGDTVPAWDVTLTFDDASGSGFSGTGAGIFITKGTATYGMTLKSENNPPTNRWSAGLATVDVTLDWTTFQDCGKVQGSGTWDVENTTFTNSGSDFVVHLQYLTKFANVTITTTTGDGMYMADDFLEYYNVVITSGSGQTDVQAEARLEFQYSNWDISKTVFGGLGPPTGGNLTSLHHNDVTGAYKVGTGTALWPRNLRKSQVTHDFDSSCDVEVFEGSFVINENADADTMFIQSGAIVVQDAGTILDVSTNLTVNGTLIGNGTVTDSANYFDFYIGGGSVWLNNSTVSNAKLAYYYDGFNFTIGNSANSTINEWTLEAPSGIDTAFNVTFYDFSRKVSGVIWHMNATAISGSVKFVTTNLTAGDTYQSYVDLVQHTEGTASGDAYNFTVSMSTKHIHLRWIAPDSPGAGIIAGIGATFDYIIIDENTVEFRPEPIGRFDITMISYYWQFSDGETSNEMNPTKTFAYTGITADFTASLTVCNEKYCSHPVERNIHLIRWWLIVLILVAIITPIILGAWRLDKKHR